MIIRFKYGNTTIVRQMDLLPVKGDEINILGTYCKFKVFSRVWEIDGENIKEPTMIIYLVDI